MFRGRSLVSLWLYSQLELQSQLGRTLPQRPQVQPAARLRIALPLRGYLLISEFGYLVVYLNL